MSDRMTLNDYQHQAQRTANATTSSAHLENGVLGLCGEAGEVADLWKKYLYQGHELEKVAMMEEAGDALWYIAELANGLGVTLEDIAAHNIAKLRKRYPEGFDPARSRCRETE